MKIAQVQAYPSSFPVEDGPTLGIGRAVKRDAVMVKISTDEGITGWGESHHGRCPGAIAHLIDTTLAQLIIGMEAGDTTGVWQKIYKMQLGSHGMGAAACLAMSGIDMALWDIRGKAAGWPLYKLLGGRSRSIPAYAGGVSLGYQASGALAEEAGALLAQGYKALKLRVGDTPRRDIERVTAVRRAHGDSVALLVDANTGYSLDDVRAAMPGLEANGVAWLEEPFPPHDHRRYSEAKRFASVPLAAGENHYTRFEFTRIIEDGSITILQPDLSKTGGITEALRIAALASAWKLPIHPHTSGTGLNMAASIHLLAAIENGGYFEADTAKVNLFRDQLTTRPYVLDREGCVQPLEGPGLGLEVDEGFLAAHPLIEGPAYV